MTTYFVTRHSGAIEWAKAQGIDVSKVVAHATPEFLSSLKKGDKVIGILPVSLACQVCQVGAEFYDLALPNITPELRGKELTAAQMTACGAEIKRYIVTT